MDYGSRLWTNEPKHWSAKWCHSLATTLAISAWLLSSGVSGAFGIAASNAGELFNQAQQSGATVPNNAPNVTADQARDFAGNAAKVGWSFVLGSLLGLAASLLGASIGTRHPRTQVKTTVQ